MATFKIPRFSMKQKRAIIKTKNRLGEKLRGTKETSESMIDIFKNKDLL